MADLATEASAVDRMISSHRAEFDREQELERNKNLDGLTIENKRLAERVDRLTVLIFWISGLTLSVAAFDSEFVLHPDWIATSVFFASAVLILAILHYFVLAARRK